MQFSTAFIIAAAAFLPLIEAHMKMVSPKPYPDNTDNFPLDASGSNFPCKFPGGVGTMTAATETFLPGGSGTWSLQGSAVHGGGSCQVSITYDNPPTKNSVFKVVQSYEGGCPMSIVGNNGNDASQAGPSFPFTLPDGLKAGDATFAWTWFNKVGNREMYMNCAPIKIGGSGNSDDVFNGLPNMFVANINNAPGNACTTTEGVDIVFPDAGDNVLVGTGAFGAACAGGPTTPGGSGNGGNNNPPPAQTSSAPQFNDGNGAPTAVPTFSNIDSQPTMAPPVQTTMVVVPTPVPEPTTQQPPIAQPTGGNNSGSSGSSCNPSSESIICGSDLSMYSQCFMDGIARGPYAVPPGTVCDSTGMGGFKAKSAVSTRFLRRSARFHRRNLVHAHSF